MKKPWIIKAGGELLVSPDSRKTILRDLRRLHALHPIVFVHGGGPQIESELKKSGIPVQFIQGRRVTSDEAIKIIERVLSGEINKGVTAELVSLGILAVGLSCRDGGLITAERLPDLGRAGRPRKIRSALLEVLLGKKILPIVSSIGSDKKGEAININADDVASALATTLKAAHLVLLTNVSGVLDQRGIRIPTLKSTQIKSLIEKGVVQGGMIPKVQSAVAALKKGVAEINIVNGKNGVSLNDGTRIIP